MKREEETEKTEAKEREEEKEDGKLRVLLENA